ncbi:HAMP domain-containing sensor histidine kinase [Aureispira sp. CCB-E]|uniref:sensor histidine kinase n=1 Tax=Aureispira sp. CCB-E TaxID=3051121 RepID=UPI0028691291|nr:HAMP domain-containing sensor histidine kinase [Aureispira sp. CCB-E]WMX16472.1 HAMP domain-containing sensor histidine kinase [Aureispira sp. CCB-E]
MKKPKLYERTRWRFALIIIALIVVATSILYTNTVVYQLKLDEEKRVKLWFDAQKAMFNATPEEVEFCNFELYFSIMERNSDIPIILTDEHYRIMDVMNYEDKDAIKDTAYFNKEIAYLKKHQKPLVIEDDVIKNYLFYRQSTLITSLEWFPYFQFALLGVLLMLSYFTFSFNRQAEQERVWVGMAKETAHQLGTPLTSLMGWIQNINMMYPDDEDLLMIAEEMNTDVELLKLVADRFSKIGAVPKLEPINVYDNLNKHLQYVQQRASRKITFDFPDPTKHAALMVNINPLLFDWVVENLLKNALDALEGKGQIEARVIDGEYFVHIDISDTGKGIPKRSFKSVFQPGYSTKKRGWGLGLSLCKRIVEKYHNGKIFVLKSTEGKGTTFRIQLPQIK